MSNKSSKFIRSQRILGDKTMTNLENAKVILFGIGGVGSWCAEALIRAGLYHLDIVDFDRISESNINRQLMATSSTIGEIKVDALKKRLLDINPNANIQAIRQLVSDENLDSFHLEEYDYIIDAVDSLKDKAALILYASKLKGRLFSSMGAALKIDPRRVNISEFWEVRGCPLAAALRKKFNRAKTFPKHKFLCVYGDEVLANIGYTEEENYGTIERNKEEDKLSIKKAVTNGSLAHITGIFGFSLAGLIIQDIFNKSQSS